MKEITDESPIVHLTVGELKSIIKESVKEVVVKELKNFSNLVNEDEKVYTLQEAAQYLKMSEPSLRVYLRNGDISGSRLGKRWMFNQKDLNTFLKRFRVSCTQDVMEERMRKGLKC